MLSRLMICQGHTPTASAFPLMDDQQALDNDRHRHSFHRDVSFHEHANAAGNGRVAFLAHDVLVLVVPGPVAP